MDCDKRFTAKRWADMSTAIRCPTCGKSSGVISKGHPWYPNENTKTDN